MKEPLTIEQQNLVTENHNLIYEFAKRKHLPVGECYDILAIGLCNAASMFNGDRGKFSTIANRSMENAMTDYYREINKCRSIPANMIVSYDAQNSDDDCEGTGTYLDCLANNHCTYEVVASDMMSEFLIGLLSEKEKVVVKLLISGMTHDEIAAYMGCKRQNIQYYIKQIRKKWLAHMNNN